ncbi:MAG TPA: metallophosphoesterase [Candidatus Cybelea sp.]|nr:metallophosphoesterase [Candidatus Cybelea sp.]
MSQPTRLALLSDMHLDIRRRRLIRDGASEAEADAQMRAFQDAARTAAAGADVALVLGDVCEGDAGIAWTAATFPGLPAVYVAGNHEYYRHDLTVFPADLAAAAAASGSVRFLDLSVAEFAIRGRALRILGATLWTDYALYDGAPAADSMKLAAERMYDHQRIDFGAGRIFQPEDALMLHRRARAWLAETLAQPFAGTTIVATHHAPASGSVEPRFQRDRLSPAFASELGDLILRLKPALWLHGHTHYNVDYRLGETRVVSHQWGYPHEGPPLAAKIIEVPEAMP